ncbi:MAG: HD domain-containing protein [Deltaproteobacteria bacterium]|nr:HD domain-containing protein [Deltaproteobacteria bacterium]
MSHSAPPTSSSLQTPSATVSFADVAHQTLIFDTSEPTARLVLELTDTPWVQRLRRLKQTGNTNLVYMFAEHSRFGHSLGVAYLATRLMRSLKKYTPDMVAPYELAVAAAALLHDVGHVAPGSHLGEKIWSPRGRTAHERVSVRVLTEDRAIRSVLERYDPRLPEIVGKILSSDETLPPWTVQIISGGGWNADRGNWTIVDSTMASVTYGRYNVAALIDAFRISEDGTLVLQESRLDALTHFFVARDSMYRQVYQHRVTQGVDLLCEHIVVRIRELLSNARATPETAQTFLQSIGVFCDLTMARALLSDDYGRELGLDSIFAMSEGWWSYHVERWCETHDNILADLAQRLRDRRLLKTVRLEAGDTSLVRRATEVAAQLGLDPRYYVLEVSNADRHRGKSEELPRVLLDSGHLVEVTDVEPLIAELLQRSDRTRSWIAVPKEVKEKLGRIR